MGLGQDLHMLFTFRSQQTATVPEEQWAKVLSEQIETTVDDPHIHVRYLPPNFIVASLTQKGAASLIETLSLDEYFPETQILGYKLDSQTVLGDDANIELFEHILDDSFGGCVHFQREEQGPNSYKALNAIRRLQEKSENLLCMENIEDSIVDSLLIYEIYLQCRHVEGQIAIHSSSVDYAQQLQKMTGNEKNAAQLLSKFVSYIITQDILKYIGGYEKIS